MLYINGWVLWHNKASCKDINTAFAVERRSAKVLLVDNLAQAINELFFPDNAGAPLGGAAADDGREIQWLHEMDIFGQYLASEPAVAAAAAAPAAAGGGRGRARQNTNMRDQKNNLMQAMRHVYSGFP